MPTVVGHFHLDVAEAPQIQQDHCCAPHTLPPASLLSIPCLVRVAYTFPDSSSLTTHIPLSPAPAKFTEKLMTCASLFILLPPPWFQPPPFLSKTIPISLTPASLPPVCFPGKIYQKCEFDYAISMHENLQWFPSLKVESKTQELNHVSNLLFTLPYCTLLTRMVRSPV